jgi:DNA-binding NarL/FixJ family response regulator
MGNKCLASICDKRTSNLIDCSLDCEFRMLPISWADYQDGLDRRREEISRLFRTGKSVEAIASHLRMHPEGIRRFLSHRGMLGRQVESSLSLDEAGEPEESKGDLNK